MFVRVFIIDGLSLISTNLSAIYITKENDIAIISLINSIIHAIII